VTPVVVGSQVKTVDAVVGDIMAESARREAIVRRLYANCPYKPGDTVVPKTKAARDEWGEKLIVTAMVDSYAKFGKDEIWPSNDDPMIVHVKSYDKDTHFICSTGYLMKKKDSA